MTKVTLVWLRKYLEEIPQIKFSTTERRDIINAVEKRIKKPLIFSKRISKLNALYTCPICKRTKYITNSEKDYPLCCSHCGQRLDWKGFIRDEQVTRNKYRGE